MIIKKLKRVKRGKLGNDAAMIQTQSSSFKIKFSLKTNLELYSFCNYHITLRKASREIFNTDKNMLEKVQNAQI